MSDAYKFGIVIALGNGVSEGLTAIRRDLIVLNRVVDSSGMSLKHFAPPAVDLRIGHSRADPIDMSEVAPARRASDVSTPDVAVSSPLDRGGGGLNSPNLLMSTASLMPILALTATQPTANVGAPQTNRPETTSPPPWSLLVNSQGLSPTNLADFRQSDQVSVAPSVETHPFAPSVPRSMPILYQQVAGAMVSDFSTVGKRSEVLSPSAIMARSSEEAGDYLFEHRMASSVQSSISDEMSSLPQPTAPDMPTTLEGQHAAPHPPQAPVVGSRADPIDGPRIAPSGTSWPYQQDAGPTLASAIPPSRESQSSPLQGEIYVDGLRLGRWMTDRLAKSAELPRAAMTGFDPRLTPTWPGAPVGS